MVSKFVGRDYSTLRTEIIEFLRQRFPQDWDYTNLSDPMVIAAECIARMGDQLHYTLDEIRRECDVATAKRASSIYSYAMREGYKMMLPRGAFGTLSINSSKEQSGSLHLSLEQFSEIKVKSTGDTLYVVDKNDPDTGKAFDADLYAPIDEEYAEDLRNYVNPDNSIDPQKRNIYAAYVEDAYNKTQHVHVVAGKKETFYFSYSDINNDSTVELPNPIIDRELIRLTATNSQTPAGDNGTELTYVDDVIASGFNRLSYTLTPKFIGGAIVLCIEFPTNYRDIFNSDTSYNFTFEYISIQNTKVDANEENANSLDFGDGISIKSDHEEDPDIVENGMQFIIDLGNGIKGYTEYEDPMITRENYKKFVQDYSALLTKADYESYIKATTSQHCQVFDHSDNYKSPAVLPEGSDLLERSVYVLTDAPYEARKTLWNDLKERSSRSDCIIPVPYGKDPYTIIVKAECYLLGTSVATVATQIKAALLKYYAESIGEKIPDSSMINYLVHKASDTVIRMDNLIVRDSTYGTIDSTFSNVNTLSNSDIDKLYNALDNGNIAFHVDIKHAGAEPGEGFGDTEKHYYLLGIKEVVTNPGPPEEKKYCYYNKYPKVTHQEVDDSGTPHTVEGYGKFPDAFPKIYQVAIDGSIISEIQDYETLVDHQIVYGELDSRNWDYADDSLFEVLYSSDNPSKPSDTDFDPPDKPDDPADKQGIASIKEDYIRHHYMVPVLNNVVVLIKAVSK